jgi:hypothetical protein
MRKQFQSGLFLAVRDLMKRTADKPEGANATSLLTPHDHVLSLLLKAADETGIRKIVSAAKWWSL